MASLLTRQMMEKGIQASFQVIAVSSPKRACRLPGPTQAGQGLRLKRFYGCNILDFIYGCNACKIARTMTYMSPKSDDGTHQFGPVLPQSLEMEWGLESSQGPWAAQLEHPWMTCPQSKAGNGTKKKIQGSKIERYRIYMHRVYIYRDVFFRSGVWRSPSQVSPSSVSSNSFVNSPFLSEVLSEVMT